MFKQGYDQVPLKIINIFHTAGNSELGGGTMYEHYASCIALFKPFALIGGGVMGEGRRTYGL